MTIEGTYKKDDCTVTNPEVTIYSMGRDLANTITTAFIFINDKNDGFSFKIKDESEPSEWTTEASYVWLVEQLQQYRI